MVPDRDICFILELQKRYRSNHKHKHILYNHKHKHKRQQNFEGKILQHTLRQQFLHGATVVSCISF